MSDPTPTPTPHDPLARVDPFIGCETAQLLPPQGIAATWWWPKAQVGNTHPGATRPMGMVSACPHSGAYPTGYGLYAKNTDGIPDQLFDHYQATGFTHFQQSGTGAIRKYYNYLRVTPWINPPPTSKPQTQHADAAVTPSSRQTTFAGFDHPQRLLDEHASPGYYRCRYGNTGITAELTAAPKAVVHRYTFPKAHRANLIVDCSRGGIAIPFGKTVPTVADIEVIDLAHAQVRLVVEGVPLYAWIELAPQLGKFGVWLDHKNVGGGRQLVFDHIRESTLSPFGLHFGGPTEADQPVELRIGFSWRSAEQARANLNDLPDRSFDAVHDAARQDWTEKLSRITVEGGPPTKHVVFDTAVYHSLVKPADAQGESPFWPGKSDFVFDLCTMWDLYKTQLPLLLTVYPEQGARVVRALLTICEQEGNFPIGYRMARGTDRFQGQASALAHVTLLDAFHRDLPGIDWDSALTYMVNDLHRAFGETFLESNAPVHPITHTLDLAYGCWCTATLARALGDHDLANNLDQHAHRWRSAFDPDTGLLIDSTFYEGGKWNYSFRLLHDMAGRIELAGGDEPFLKLLDAFFGFDADAVVQLGDRPYGEAVTTGYALNRFEGLNNEPDMEAPWAYHYAGRPDRTAHIVHAVLDHAFHTGRGGLPGNDDSGGLSSWVVWSALGLFPVAGQDVILLATPYFPAARVTLPAGPLTITAPRDTPAQQHVQTLTRNGEPLDRAWLTVAELLDTKTLDFTLSDTPSQWGTTERPPSASP